MNGPLAVEQAQRSEPGSKPLDGEVNLIRLSLQGCHDSFVQLADRYRPRLLVILDRFLMGSNPRIDPEDVAQEALMKAYQNLVRFDFKHRFSTWLYTIAFRVARDHLRQNRRWSRLVSLGRNKPWPAGDQVVDTVSLDEQAGCIWQLAKELLSADQYAALWLRFGEELSPVEISEVLGKKQGTVRVLLHRSRLKLIEHLQTAEAGIPPRRDPSNFGSEPR